MSPCACRVHSSRSDSPSREVSARAPRRWHSLQSALFSSTTISATCFPHASQMTTLATSFAIGDFLARGSGACLGFRPFRRSDSASGYPFGNESNYVCHKRTCDRRLSQWNLPAVLSSRKPLTLVFLNTTEIAHDVQRIVDPHLDWGPRRGGVANSAP